MKKKILSLGMAALLTMQLLPMAYAAERSSDSVSLEFNTTAIKIGDNVLETDGTPGGPVYYDSMTDALKDLVDGELTDDVVYVVSREHPVKIIIDEDQTIVEKVVFSSGDEEAESLDSGESLEVNFPEIEIATETDSHTVTFSGGLEVQRGASLVLDNNTRNEAGPTITYAFSAPVIVNGSLKFDGNAAGLGSAGGTSGPVTFSDDATLTVANGGEVIVGGVAVTGDATSPLFKVEEGGKLDFTSAGASSYSTIETSGTAIEVAGGEVSIDTGKINATGDKPAITVGKDAELTISGGKITGSNGQPAIDAANGATVVIPEDSKAEIKSEGGNAAIDLAPGASVQQGGNTITVAPVEDESASNYVDNHGNIVLESGSEDGKVAPNTVIQPDGTAISGKNDLPTVDSEGNVTVPEGGATITNPEGDKVEVDSDTEIPSIVIGVKDAETGKVETSKSIKLGGGTLTLETAVFDSEINFDEYTCTSVTSNPANIVTTELQENGTVLVTPVSTGTATITATYAKDNGAAEGIALLDEGEATADDTLTATFNVTVENESSGGGGGGGSSSSTTYAISVEDSKNGSVSVSPKRAEKGDTVTITVKPDTGYELDELTVTDKNGDKIKLTEKDDNKFTFKMPGSKVTVETSFKLIETEPENPFTDISKNDYFYDAVLWAADKGVTSGVTDTLFAPNSSCTRAQMVTFLWRANGSPVVDYAMNFTDVPADAYYADAVRWAVSKGITSGTSATTFAPDMTVTRAQTVTFLYRAAGTPAVSGGSFADVDANAYYADAVAWAVSEGITSGTSATTFSPDAACTRGQIVTFLYRAQ